MSSNSRTAWTEGMFLGPQHFQQHDRFLLNQLAGLGKGLSGHPFGLLNLEIDEGALREGKVALNKVAGIFSNGTPFNLPADEPLPDPLEIDQATRNTVVSLAIPIASTHDKDIAEHKEKGNFSQYILDNSLVADRHSPDSDNEESVFTAKLWTRLVLENDDQSAYHTIPIARVVERREDNTLILDKEFYSCAMSLAATPPLVSACQEISGLVQQRASELAKRLGTPNASDSTQLTQFFLLQILNRSAPLLKHIVQSASMHPERCYEELVQLAGEMETITTNERLAVETEAYIHRDQFQSFSPVIQSLRKSLNWIPDSKTESYPVNHVKAGIYTSTIAELHLFDSARFILAAKARVTPDELSRKLPQQSTISSKQKLKELVQAQSPGVEIKPLMTVPSSIPSYESYVYFELKQDSPLWRDIASTGDIALHIAGTPSGLEMQMWTIQK